LWLAVVLVVMVMAAVVVLVVCYQVLHSRLILIRYTQ
jgi:hypothetical protein